MRRITQSDSSDSFASTVEEQRARGPGARALLALGAAVALVATSACQSGEGGGSTPESFLGDSETGSASAGSSGSDGTDETGESSSGGSEGGEGGNAPWTPDDGMTGSSVAVQLERSFGDATVVSFGVPLPNGEVKSTSEMRVTSGGEALPATIVETLGEHDANGARKGVRAVLVQFPATFMPGDTLEVAVEWGLEGQTPATDVTPFDAPGVSAESASTAVTVDRTIATGMAGFELTAGVPQKVTLFTGREPRVRAIFPHGYLASTGILGSQVTAEQAAGADTAGASFLSGALLEFGSSAMYDEQYPLNPADDSVIDPIADYSGWLYDRCATFLSAYFHLGDERFLRHGLRSCAHFAREIELAGPNRGIFKGKPDVDTKYSHARGLYAYYALTGDEVALEAGKAIAEMWQNEPYFVTPYLEGHTRGVDKLWTERLLATSLEGLYYGHRFTGDAAYLATFEQMLTTAYAHVTGDAATLAAINPGVDLPPQGCFIHSGLQHNEADATNPWCSPWMSELLVEPLTSYEDQTGDERASEIIVRLGRFLRDVGTTYMTSDLVYDSFLAPTACDDPNAGDNRRRLVPLYGAGIDAAGVRKTFGDYTDHEHCADAAALAAATLRSLDRLGQPDAGPVGPFATERESMIALFEELSSCAERVFAESTRTNRDPSSWTSAALAEGAADPAGFIASQKIGYPLHVIMPQRKLSWWFNTSLLEFGMLAEAGVAVPALETGFVEPASCPQ